MSFFDDASLAFLPSGAAGKDGKAYSIKPTDGTGDFTFSRGSNLAATRVGADGLIEKGRENLLIQSNQFDTTWALTNGSSVTSGQSGYDGTNDAWLLTDSGDVGSYALYEGISNVGVLTASIYAKSASTNVVELDLFGSPSPYVQVNLTTGSITNASNHIDAQSVSVGNGWWRISVTSNLSSTSYIRVGCDGAGSIYIQDAQMEIGLAATDVISTGATTGKAGLLEDEPRFDYSGGATCPSLLLEPSRTNLITQSEYYGGSAWIKTNVVVTDNDAISPEGVQNAAKVVTSSGSVNVKQDSISVTPSTTYTFSFWCKLTSGTTLKGRFYDNTAGADIEYYDYTSQLTIGEWARVERTFTTPAGCTSIQVWLLAQSATLVTAHYWGAQAEAGSYPTSYIPNHSGGSVTRGADVCTGAGDATTFNDSEGVLYAEISALANDGTFRNISVSNGTTAQAIRIYYRSNDDQITFLLGSSSGGGITTSIPSATDYIKVAAKYDTDTIKLFVNGALINTISSLTMPTGLQQLDFNIANVLPFYGNAKQVLYFPTALSDADCITLTTL